MGGAMRQPFARLADTSRPSRSPRTLLALVMAAGLCCAEPASAAPPSGLLVVAHPLAQPGFSYFKLEAQPGSAQRAGSIELRNPSAKPMRVALGPVDGETLSTLGSAYAPPGSSAHGSTLWLRVARRAVTLLPRTSADVAISIVIPSRAAPGDYLSGVSIEALDQEIRPVKPKGVSIASAGRYAIGVEVSVPGPRRPLIQFTGAALQRQPAGLVFLLMARNSGNTILKGVHGYAQISRGGHPVVSIPIEAGTFVSNTSIAYPIPAFRETPAEGTRYRVSARMVYPGGIALLDTTLTFGHREAVIQQRYGRHPASGGGTAWWKIAGVAAVMLYALFTTALLLRRRKRERRETVHR
jgi:hypothetical protein